MRYGLELWWWYGFLFVLAYQVGLNVVTLRPVLDRTNWQVDSLWRILSPAYLWLGSVDLWILAVSVKRFCKYSGYSILLSQSHVLGTATKNVAPILLKKFRDWDCPMKMSSCNLKNVVVKRPLQTALLMFIYRPKFRVVRGGFGLYGYAQWKGRL